VTEQRDAPATVFVDADNTLWDTDGVFAAAQLGLLAQVEETTHTTLDVADRLAYVRAIDQEIAERHHAGLRYPPKLLISATAAALGGEQPLRAARLALTGSLMSPISGEALAAIEQRYFADLGSPPALRPGVADGLLALEHAQCVVLIVTEGARAKIARNTSRLGLDGHFTRIVEGPKRADLYRRVLRLSGTPGRAFMVGDQLDRDIAPAKVAGLETIYFPGGFQPRWTPAIDQVRPDHIVVSFAEAAGIILQAGDRGASTTSSGRATG
jgi:putative hydrolase of the HAD superfamily